MWIILFLLFTTLSAATPQEQVHLFLELNDPFGAQEALKGAPQDDPQYVELTLKTLSKFETRAGNIRLLQYLKEHPIDPLSIAVRTRESICWSFLKAGALAAQPQMRLEALIGAASANQAEGVRILNQLLEDPHSGIRRLVYTVGAQIPDQIFQDVAISALDSELSFEARIEAIELLGGRENSQARNALLTHLKKEHLHPEERLMTISALSNHSKQLDPIILETLISSSDPYDRLLACQIASESKYKLLLPLINDPHADVASEALHILGLKLTSWEGTQPTLSNFRNKASWSWFLFRMNDPKGLDLLNQQLSSPLRDERLIAFSRLKACGKSALPQIEQAASNPDPLIRLNALQTLIQWGKTDYCQKLLDNLAQTETAISQEDDGLFSYLDENAVDHTPLIPRLPETEDLLTRLELIALVARTQTVDTKPILKAFLQEKTFGIAIEAALFISSEFEYEGLEVLNTLCNDPDHSLRIQAALLLGILLQEEKALNILMDEYPSSRTDTKALILAAIAEIGSKKAIPFLFQALQENSEQLRIRAAWALLATES